MEIKIDTMKFPLTLLQNDKSFYKEITVLQKELDYIRKKYGNKK